MAHPDPGAVPRRPQHISSIAHLFLQDGSLRQEAPLASPRTDLAVATPGVSAISAFAAAGLAAASSRPVTLAEDTQIRWSAKNYLPDELVQQLPATGAKDDYRRAWTFRPAGAEISRDRTVRWNHLGCLGRIELAHLESVAALHGLVAPPRLAVGGLVWCLLAGDAGRFGPGYLLGRLVEIVRPDHLAILVFPDPWAGAGRPGWLDAIKRFSFAEQDPRLMTRCREVAGLVCRDIPLSMHPIEGMDNFPDSFLADDGENSLWKRVGDRILSGPTEC
jgi:hypothetical protein